MYEKTNIPTLRMVYFVLVLTAVFYLFGVSDQFKPTPDSCEYLGLAQSMEQGHGYTFNGREGSFYPPLISLMCVGPIHIAHQMGRPGLDIFLLKVIQSFAAFLLAYGSWRLAKRRLDDLSAALVGLAVLANIAVFQHCMFIVSDVLYAALMVGALVMLSDQRRWSRWLMGSAMLGLACLTRSIGLFAVGGIILALLLGRWNVLTLKDRLKRLPITIAVALGPFIYWKLNYAIVSDSYIARWQLLTGKTGFLEILWERFVSQLSVVPLRSVQILLNIEQITLPLFFVAIIFAVILLGWGIRFVRDRAPAEWFVLCYMAVMNIWFDQGTRFYIPMLPFFIAYAMTGVTSVVHYLNERRLGSQTLPWLTSSAIIFLGWPWIQYIITNNAVPSVMAALRQGYIYGMAAIALGLAMMLMQLVSRRRRQNAWTLKQIAYPWVGIYLLLGIVYIAAFAVFEHGWAGSRGPMLQGYDPYYKMGQWLKDQPDIIEPVLCSNASIVHLAGGKMTVSPETTPIETVKENLNNGIYSHIATIRKDRPDMPVDPENKMLQTIVGELADRFTPIRTGRIEPGLTAEIYAYYPTGHPTRCVGDNPVLSEAPLAASRSVTHE